MGRTSVHRRGARAFGRGAALAAAAVLVVACMETRRSLGEDCLKNDDCLSGICSSLSCAASPPIIGTEPVADAAPAVDAGATGLADASEAQAADGSPDDEGGSVD